MVMVVVIVVIVSIVVVAMVVLHVVVVMVVVAVVVVVVIVLVLVVLVLWYWHWSFWNDVHCYWRYHCSQPKGNLTQDGRQLELRREALGKISLPSFDTWPAWSS